MIYREVIQVLDDVLVLLSKHRCVDDLKERVVGYRRYLEILYSLNCQASNSPDVAEMNFHRCFTSKKGYGEYTKLLDEVKRRTTAQLTTGMRMFKHKARQSIALRNKRLLVRR